MKYATIRSTGCYLPEVEVPNSVLAGQLAHVPDFVAKMEAGTGIRKRWYAPEGWVTSDLALPAARQALERAGRKPEDVDLIILGTDSPDYITPATSVVLQHKLGAKNAGTFDAGCACASFPTGLAAGAGLIATNPRNPHGPGAGRLSDAPSRQSQGPDGLFLWRWRRRRCAGAGHGARIPRFRVPGRRLLSTASGAFTR